MFGLSSAPRHQHHLSPLALSVCVVIMAMVLLCIGSCNRPVAQTTPVAARTEEGHGLHEVNNERLRTVMGQLASLDIDSLKREPGDAAGSARITDVAQTAAMLACEARAIPTIYRDATMNDEARRVFNGLAARLESECGDLSRAAERRDAGGVHVAVQAIQTTCNECHASFRGIRVAGVVHSVGMGRDSYNSNLVDQR